MALQDIEYAREELIRAITVLDVEALKDRKSDEIILNHSQIRYLRDALYNCCARLSLYYRNKSMAKKANKRQSHITDFFENRIILSKGDKVQASLLYEKYEEYCQDKGYDAVTVTAFGNELRDLGYTRKKTSQANYYLGIKIRAL